MIELLSNKDELGFYEHKQLTTYFSSKEFDSPDLKYSGRLIDIELVDKLELLRDFCGFPIFISSGVRTVEYNKRVGGKKNSEHLQGKAVDIKCVSSRRRYFIVLGLLNLGFNRIGIGKNFIHAGISDYLTKDVIWNYYS